MKPTKILHPTAYSSIDDPALHEALALAKQHNANLVLLHVVDTLGPEKITFSEATQPQPETYRKRLWDELRHVLPADTPVHVEFVLSEEDVVTAILRSASEMGCDLIVMGSHGRHGWERWVVRSIAEEVVRKAPCPVLVVKDHPKPPELPEYDATDLHPGHLTESPD